MEGTFNKDMTRDETIFEGHDMNRSNTLSQMYDHILACECAFGGVFSVHPAPRSWQLLLSGRETARKNKKKLRNAGDYEWKLDSSELDSG